MTMPQNHLPEPTDRDPPICPVCKGDGLVGLSRDDTATEDGDWTCDACGGSGYVCDVTFPATTHECDCECPTCHPATTGETPERKLLRDLIRRWYCVEGTSASDLLDEIAADAVAAGVATNAEIAAWDAEENDGPTEFSAAEAKARLACLKAARELIATPETWGQHWTAQTDIGAVTSPCAPDACRFCMYGAIARAAYPVAKQYGLTKARVTNVALDAIEATVGGKVWDFNDAEGRTHAEVLAVFDGAIRDAEAALL